jgi:glycosyltransferase involved in cell wall biosynthesis
MKKILIIPDVPNWAFDIIANEIIKYIPGFEFYKTYASKFDKKLLNKQYDNIYFMSWLNAPMFYDLKSVSVGIWSHNYELLHSEKANLNIPKVNQLMVSSKILLNKLKTLNKTVSYVRAGVDENKFTPVKKIHNKKFIVGWVGQATKGSFGESKPIDMKGYENLLKPFVEEMRQFKNIEFKILDNNHNNNISYSEMPKFYDNVNCQICTSLYEGGPRPMFEAATSGIPLISTRVGAICEFIEDDINGYLIDCYKSKEEIPKTIEQFKKYILKLKNNRDLCDLMGENNRKKIELSWSWNYRIPEWTKFFNFEG